MAVLQILHGNKAARSSRKTGVCCIVVVGCALRRVAEQVCVVDTSTTRVQRRQKVFHALSTKAGVGASNIATSVSIIASEITSSRVNDLHFLDPGVGRSLTKYSSDGCNAENELHCRWFLFGVLKDGLMKTDVLVGKRDWEQRARQKILEPAKNIFVEL